MDEATAKALAAIAKVDMEELAGAMFEAGEALDGKTPQDVFLQDYKTFDAGGLHFGVGQGSYMTEKNRKQPRPW